MGTSTIPDVGCIAIPTRSKRRVTMWSIRWVWPSGWCYITKNTHFRVRRLLSVGLRGPPIPTDCRKQKNLEAFFNPNQVIVVKLEPTRSSVDDLPI